MIFYDFYWEKNNSIINEKARNKGTLRDFLWLKHYAPPKFLRVSCEFDSRWGCQKTGNRNFTGYPVFIIAKSKILYLAKNNVKLYVRWGI